MKKKIAVFAAGWGSAILSQYLEGLTQALVNEPADTFLFLSYPGIGRPTAENVGEFSVFNLPDLSEFDGVVIFANSIDNDEINNELILRCQKAGIPVISHGRELAGSYAVTINNYEGMCGLVEHLIEKHHVKRVVYMAGSKASPDSNERLRATRDTLNAHDIPFSFDDICYTDFDNRKASEYIKTIITQKGIPDAIVCVNDGVAMAVCLALGDMNISVPCDVIVTGFDYIHEGQLFYPSLTTIDQHFTHLGAESGRLLLDILKGNFCAKKSELTCHFILGESCGCQDVSVNDILRRKAGRDSFALKNQNEVFEMKTGALEGAIGEASNYEELISRINNTLSGDREFEGNNFHVMLDPKFRVSVANNNNEMLKGSFSSEVDVIFSNKEGVIQTPTKIKTRDLLPGYSLSDAPHLYIFLPLNDGVYTMGYLVFADNISIIDNRLIQKYRSKVIGALNSFRQTQAMAHLNAELVKLSQLDSLTHVKSRAAFRTREQELEELIKTDSDFEFGIAMFDINNLKVVNDTLGHDMGDQYIINCCKLICDTFKYSSVYRIGGDEFTVVLTGKDYNNRLNLLDKIQETLLRCENRSLPLEEQLSFASGLSVFDPTKDRSVQDVFKVADANMYENKKLMKLGSIR